jgi:hypothetical protein
MIDFMRRTLALATVLAAACLTSPEIPGTLPVGTWGGEDAGLLVRDDGVHAHIGCTLGDVPGSIPLDPDGRFEVTGQWNVNAFPIDLGIVHPARLSGRTDGRTLRFTVVLTDTGQSLGPAIVRFGREPKMVNCPICRNPDRAPARR